MVKAIVAFLDFCYLVRRPSHTEETLTAMDIALNRFHHYRTIFIQVQVRANFSLPRQHSLVHYVRSIRLFGSPNGLCSSITESKHIRAVKETWRRGSRNQAALQQMVNANVRLGKISAARADFAARGMLNDDVKTAAYKEVGLYRDAHGIEEENGADGSDDDESIADVYENGDLVVDVEGHVGDVAPVNVELAKWHREFFDVFSLLESVY